MPVVFTEYLKERLPTPGTSDERDDGATDTASVDDGSTATAGEGGFGRRLAVAVGAVALALGVAVVVRRRTAD